MTAPKSPRKRASASAEARKAEAGAGYATIEQCGIDVRIPLGDNMPAAAMDIYIEGGPNTNWRALKAMVGPEQWKALLDAGMNKREVEELDRKIGEIQGN